MSIERETVEVAITGAAGQICYSLLPDILKGNVFGDKAVNLHLLELPAAMERLEGVVMELEDTASPYLGTVDLVDNPEEAFEGANFAFLIGAISRTKDMDRSDLLGLNGPIFARQGQALNNFASDDVRVLVVGNPANSNAVITMAAAPDIPVERFTAMTRLDHNRAVGNLAMELGVYPDGIQNLAIWGNHSDTMVADLTHAMISGDLASTTYLLPEKCGVETQWYQDFSKAIATRGTAVIAARGASSAMSAAKAAADHARDWMIGSEDRWHSMGVYSNGEYDVPKGLVSSFPTISKSGEFEIVTGLELPKVIKDRIAVSVAELTKEKDAMKELGLLLTER